MTTKGLRINLALPEEFAQALRGLYTRGRAPSPELCASLAAAKKRGWTLTSLGNALGITRERIRQLAEAAPADLPPVVEIPDLPPKPDPDRSEITTLTFEQRDQLRAMHRRACASGCDPSNPKVAASRELAAAIQCYLDAGHRIGEIARCLGVTRAAVASRLGRWGYRGVPPSQRYAPGPIAAHRAQTGGGL